jgi:hypothetical protein
MDFFSPAVCVGVQGERHRHHELGGPVPQPRHPRDQLCDGWVALPPPPRPPLPRALQVLLFLQFCAAVVVNVPPPRCCVSPPGFHPGLGLRGVPLIVLADWLLPGCIYSYDAEHPIGGKRFTETDPPNFFGSFYSYTKGLVEKMLVTYDNLLILRLRMPISDDLSDRNFITKISRYAKVHPSVCAGCPPWWWWGGCL